MPKTPRAFWLELKGTIAIHDVIHNNRTQLEQVIHKNKRIPDISKRILTPEYNVALELVVKATSNYHNLFSRLFYDMDKFNFKSTPSVSSAYDKHLIEYNNRFELLKEVNLLSHTMNVVIEMIKITSDEKLPQNVRDISILLSVLHDYGKNDKVSKEFRFEKENEGRHDKVSANYAKYTMQEESLGNNSSITKELITTVYTTLRAHHEPIKEKNMFLDLLCTADINARENELQGILLRQRKDQERKLK